MARCFAEYVDACLANTGGNLADDLDAAVNLIGCIRGAIGRAAPGDDDSSGGDLARLRSALQTQETELVEVANAIRQFGPGADMDPTLSRKIDSFVGRFMAEQSLVP